MRQLLIRIPDELHAALRRRADAAGCSVNQLAADALSDAVADGGPGDERARVRARAAAAGVLVDGPEAPVFDIDEFRAHVDANRGRGRFVQQWLDEGR